MLVGIRNGQQQQLTWPWTFRAHPNLDNSISDSKARVDVILHAHTRSLERLRASLGHRALARTAASAREELSCFSYVRTSPFPQHCQRNRWGPPKGIERMKFNEWLLLIHYTALILTSHIPQISYWVVLHRYIYTMCTLISQVRQTYYKQPAHITDQINTPLCDRTISCATTDITLWSINIPIEIAMLSSQVIAS